MQKFFLSTAALTALYIIFILIKQFDSSIFDNDLSKFLGGIGGFGYPLIVGVFSFLFGVKKETGENFVKIVNQGFKKAEIKDSNFGVEGEIGNKNIDIKNKNFDGANIEGSNFGIKNKK